MARVTSSPAAQQPKVTSHSAQASTTLVRGRNLHLLLAALGRSATVSGTTGTGALRALRCAPRIVTGTGYAGTTQHPLPKGLMLVTTSVDPPGPMRAPPSPADFVERKDG